MKPLTVYDYTEQMVGVDKNDQFNTYYNPPMRIFGEFIDSAILKWKNSIVLPYGFPMT